MSSLEIQLTRTLGTIREKPGCDTRLPVVKSNQTCSGLLWSTSVRMLSCTAWLQPYKPHIKPRIKPLNQWLWNQFRASPLPGKQWRPSWSRQLLEDWEIQCIHCGWKTTDSARNGPKRAAQGGPMRAPWVGAGAQWPPYGLKRVGDGRAVRRSTPFLTSGFDMSLWMINSVIAI